MGAADAARGTASRGVGRRKILRDAGTDLPGSGAPYRSDGAAVLVRGVRVCREVPGARSRARAARRGPAGLVSEDPQSSGCARTEPVAPLAWSAGQTEPAHPLRAVVGGGG